MSEVPLDHQQSEKPLWPTATLILALVFLPAALACVISALRP